MMWRFLGSLSVLVAMPLMASPIDGGLAAYAAGDYRVARAQFRPLADRGSAIAETMLGVMAAKGQGRAADPAAAVGWWLRAANRGYPPAQLALAKALAHGRGVAADPGQAWVWARLAAVGNLNGEAMALSIALEKSFDGPLRARLKVELAAWRPWQAL